MKKENIKPKHIYYVDFNPTKRGEFDKKHLVVVLKTNKSNVTFVVMPLTSKGNGRDVNIINIGDLGEALPKNLRGTDTYAVFDQIRTVSYERFSELFDDGLVYEAIMPNEKMRQVYEVAVEDLLFNTSGPEAFDILGNVIKSLAKKK
mgnify:CR=1 FL=1